MRSTSLFCPAVGRFVAASLLIGSALISTPAAAQSGQAEASVGAEPPAVSAARETPTVLAIRRASPAVVNIHGRKTIRDTAAGMAGATGPESFRQVNGMGTGVIIDPRGYAITNYHVVEDVDEIQVTLHSGETTGADLVASRRRSDLALIKVHSDSPLPTIPRGTSSDLMVGEPVIAIGNAFGYVHTSTQGIISALHRDVPVNETQGYHDLIQTSAGINPGNSGGPLLNIAGQMIGVNVAVRVGAQQIAFAIPIDQVVETVTEMIEQHNRSRMVTGLRTEGGPRDGDGVTVAHVAAESPAAREGLEPGDRVVGVGSQPVDDRLDFALAMLTTAPGEPLELQLQRAGQPYEVAMLAAAVPRANAPAGIATLAWEVIGIRARPVTDARMKRLNARMRTQYQGGLYLTEIRPGSPAARQGMEAGDVLLGIHGWQTASLQDLAGVLRHPDMRRGPRAKFYIVRSERTLFGHLQLAAQARPTHR